MRGIPERVAPPTTRAALAMSDAMSLLSERRIGVVLSVYRYLGDHFKVGVGYNVTDFSDDLTDLSYDQRGVFFNVVGTL